jgi:hypothetical protein
MGLITFLVVLSGVLGICFVVCQNLLVIESRKWSESFQQLAQVTSFDVELNNANFYPSLAGYYFGLPTKLEIVQIDGCEGVLPGIQAHITIRPLKQLKYSFEITRNSFLSREKIKTRNPSIDEDFIINGHEVVRASELLAPISLQKKLSEIYFNQLSIKQDELRMIVNDVEGVIDDFVYYIDVLYRVIDVLDNLHLESPR